MASYHLALWPKKKGGGGWLHRVVENKFSLCQSSYETQEYISSKETY